MPAYIVSAVFGRDDRCELLGHTAIVTRDPQTANAIGAVAIVQASKTDLPILMCQTQPLTNEFLRAALNDGKSEVVPLSLVANVGGTILQFPPTPLDQSCDVQSRPELPQFDPSSGSESSDRQP